MKWLTRIRWMASGVALLYVMSALAGVAFGGALDPPGAPGPTMKTLDDIPGSWSRKLPANDGADGCSSSRFRCVLNGTAVLDLEPGLVWQRSLYTFEESWYVARNRCYEVNTDGRFGYRLPTIEELKTVLQETTGDRLPAGHPFENVPFGVATTFWPATTSPTDVNLAYVHGTSTIGGGSSQQSKALNFRYWCVRGGHGYDKP